MSLENCSYIAAIVGALVALVGFPLVAWQLSVARSQRRDAIQLSTSQVLLAADAVLATHAEVATKLRPLGDWAGKKGEVHPTIEELPLVEPYLGVFERLFVAYKVGQVHPQILDDLYGYRLDNIWANKQIAKLKLQNDALKKSWRGIIALTYVLEAHRGKPFETHTDTYFPVEVFDDRSARRILDQRTAKPERT